MSKLDLIWQLEVHSKNLRDLEEELKVLDKAVEISQARARMVDLETRLDKIRERFTSTKTRMRRKESQLRNYDFKIREMDKDLYGGEISDIKELEHLSREKDRAVKKCGLLEREFIELMENEEELEEELEKTEMDFQTMERELLYLERIRKEKEAELLVKIREHTGQAEKLCQEIPKRDLDQYKAIRKTRHRAIVKVENYICRGCNMRIPSYLGKALKLRQEIQVCEHCGRILYYLED